MKTKVICFVGFSKSGKDYIGKKVLSRFSELNKYAMADYLKYICCRVRELPIDDFESIKDENRKYLKIIAEELIKPVVPDFFVRKFLLDYEVGKHYLITDLRFKIEKETLEEHFDTTFIYIDREESFLNKECGNELTPGDCDHYFHSSEGNLDALFNLIQSIL